MKLKLRNKFVSSGSLIKFQSCICFYRINCKKIGKIFLPQHFQKYISDNTMNTKPTFFCSIFQKPNFFYEIESYYSQFAFFFEDVFKSKLHNEFVSSGSLIKFQSCICFYRINYQKIGKIFLPQHFQKCM